MTQKIRCAVYTRKSHEEGLDTAFNSLDAQRAAGEAYVLSQQHEGWELIDEKFDDGGFSGGTLERPALQRLLDKVQVGEIDVVVTYKIDRLTRSITDFGKLAELFEEHEVSFVSVTQSFNTKDSMGRLMLNVLLSFAQYERELTGERIRDKIKAQKSRGHWTGGAVPMGYDVVDRQLVVNEADAATVRSIFEAYLEEGSVPALLDRLAREDVRTPIRTSQKGTQSGGNHLSRGNLYQMLNNPIYIGKVRHKDQVHKGIHKPIIPKELWDQVQDLLADNAQGPRKRRSRADHPSLLAGLLVTAEGDRLIATHANKGRVRYRYYITETDKPIRLPAPELEMAVLNALSTFLADTSRLLPELGELRPDEIPGAIEAANALAPQLEQPLPKHLLDLFGSIVTQVTYHRDRLDIAIDGNALRQALGLEALTSAPFTLKAPLNIRRRGRQLKMHTGAAGREPDPALVTAVARGHVWASQLVNGEVGSIGEIATAEGMTVSYVSHVVRLGFLAPELVEAILSGTQPADLTADALVHDAGLPLRWGEQVEG